MNIYICVYIHTCKYLHKHAHTYAQTHTLRLARNSHLLQAACVASGRLLVFWACCKRLNGYSKLAQSFAKSLAKDSMSNAGVRMLVHCMLSQLRPQHLDLALELRPCGHQHRCPLTLTHCQLALKHGQVGVRVSVCRCARFSLSVSVHVDVSACMDVMHVDGYGPCVHVEMNHQAGVSVCYCVLRGRASKLVLLQPSAAGDGRNALGSSVLARLRLRLLL